MSCKCWRWYLVGANWLSSSEPRKDEMPVSLASLSLNPGRAKLKTPTGKYIRPMQTRALPVFFLVPTPRITLSGF